MAIAYLITPGLHVALRGERLELDYPEGVRPEDAPDHIPILLLEHVVVDVSVRMSLPALAALAERKIGVIIVRHGGKPVGEVLPAEMPVTWIERQVEVAHDDTRRLEFAKSRVRAKIINQRRLLERLAARRGLPAPAAVDRLAQCREDCLHAENPDALMGEEGAAAAAYFEALAGFFPETLPFEHRSYHPPHNEANALLSYLYTLLVSEITLRIRLSGLHPSFGFLHKADRGRPALALDLVEPLRPVVGDAMALNLLNHGRITREDFETNDTGRILIRGDARRRVNEAFDERMRHRFHSAHLGHETTLRTVIDHEINGIKGALDGRCVPEAFVMN